jgi:hypothetical protein
VLELERRNNEQLRFCHAPKFSEFEHRVPISRGVRHANPLVEVRGHLAFAKTVRRVQIGDIFDDFDPLASYGRGTNALDVLLFRRAFQQRGRDGRRRVCRFGKRIALN